jgi:hypothetical protein
MKNEKNIKKKKLKPTRLGLFIFLFKGVEDKSSTANFFLKKNRQMTCHMLWQTTCRYQT